MMRTRRTASVTVALALVLTVSTGLSGCAGETDSNASSSAASSSTASAPATQTPTPTATPRASALVIGMTSMTVLDEKGAVLQELPYGSPGGDVAYTLTQVFDREPVVSDTAGSLESWPTRNYNWNGFELRDEFRDEAKRTSWEYYLFVTTASVNGVEIRTTGGSHVGDPAANVVFDPTSPWPPESYDGVTCGAEALHSEDGDVWNSVALYLCTDDATALVSRFSVPVPLQI